MNKKKQPVKRKYVKKSDKWSRKDTINAIQANQSVQEVGLVIPTQVNPKKDKELEKLAAICSIFDNLNDEQKQRFLKFLCGRYYDLS